MVSDVLGPRFGRKGYFGVPVGGVKIAQKQRASFKKLQGCKKTRVFNMLFYTPRRWNKKCTFPAEDLDFWEVSLGPFRTMLGVPRPPQSRGASPPDLPGNVYIGFTVDFFLFLTLRHLKKCRFQGLDFLFRSFLFVRRGVMEGDLL